MLISSLLIAQIAFADRSNEGVDALFAAVVRRNARVFAECTQALLAVNRDAKSPVAAVHLFERQKGAWSRVGSYAANIGRSGFAAPGRKREGDGMSPSGIFPLESAFGYGASADTKLHYRQATADDHWVDDVDSPDYNTWVHGRPGARSWETMKREDDLYRYGIVIGYNRSPVVKGRGSAIFIHVWRGQGAPTAGCISLEEKDLRQLLRSLDHERHPLIVMGDEDTVRTLGTDDD